MRTVVGVYHRCSEWGVSHEICVVAYPRLPRHCVQIRIVTQAADYPGQEVSSVGLELEVGVWGVRASNHSIRGVDLATEGASLTERLQEP